MTALHVFTGMGFLEYDSKIDEKRISSDYSGVKIIFPKIIDKRVDREILLYNVVYTISHFP